MMLTEEEARKKWCAFARKLAFVDSTIASPAMPGGGYNRDGMTDSGPGTAAKPMTLPDCRCIASECMAWRWCSAHEHIKAGVDIAGQERPRIIGFCGLAGSP